MTIHSDTPSERSGNGPAERAGTSPYGTGSSGAPTSGTTGGPTGSASMPGSAGSSGRYDSRSSGAGDGARPGDTNRSEFGAFLDDLSELARGGHAHSDLRGEIERRVSHARERMSDAIDQGRALTVRTRDQMHRGIEYSRDAVTERPLSSVTLAAVGGLIVGLLLSRRH